MPAHHRAEGDQQRASVAGDGRGPVTSHEQERRDQFVLKMYDQMWNNITRHVNVVWQAIAAVGASVVLFSLAMTKDSVFALDYAATTIVILAAWLVINVLDAAQWFNRNITIITNIEHDFLPDADRGMILGKLSTRVSAGQIHRYFQPQLALGVVMGVMTVLYHWVERIAPNWRAVRIPLNQSTESA